MDKNAIDIINNIFDIDKKIYNVYVKLGELEENENVDLYNKYKLMLKILISSENNLFDSFGNSYECLSGLLEYIGSLTAPDFASSPIYAICDYDNEKYLSYYRMYEKIKMILMNDNQFVSDNLDTDLKIFESNKDESLNYIKIMNYNLAREYRRMNMLFLNECDDLRVVKRKYLYSFVSPLIEDEMLNNDFVINNCSFWDNLRIDSKYNIFENYIFSKTGLENTKIDLENLLDFALIEDFSILDDEYSESMIDFNSIVCSFKAGLLFLSDEDIIELKKWVEFYSHEILDNDDVKDIDDLKKLENIDEGMLSKIDRLNDICDYIEDILSHIDDYRKIANKDGNGKIFRLD